MPTNARLRESAALLQKVTRVLEERTLPLCQQQPDNTAQKPQPKSENRWGPNPAIPSAPNDNAFTFNNLKKQADGSSKQTQPLQSSNATEGENDVSEGKPAIRRRSSKAKSSWGKLATTVKAGSAFTEGGLKGTGRDPKLLYPQTLRYSLWHFVMVVVSFYYAFAVPIRFFFGWDRTANIIFQSCDILCDLVLLLNIYVQLHSAYVEMGVIFDQSINIYNHYVENEFILDLITAMPWDWLLYLVTAILGYVGFNPRPLSFVFSDVKFDQSAFLTIPALCVNAVIMIINYRLLKLLRLRNVWVYCQSIANYSSYLNTVELAKLFLSVILVGHFCGCGYYFIVELEGFSGNDWLPGEEFREMGAWRQVLMSFYWGFSALTDTLSTANPPTTLLEIFYSFFVGCVSISVYAHTIGNVGKVIKTVNGASEKYRAQRERINSYMAYRKIPQHIQMRVRQYFEYLHSKQQGYEDEHILQDFPAHLRLEIYRHLCKDIVKKVPLFKNRSQAFIDCMVVLLKPRIYSPGEYIVRVDEPGREMYFISVGSVKVLDRHGNFIVDLSVGDFFGEIAVVTQNSTRTASVVATTFCDLFVLDKADLDQILKEFPEDAYEISQVARQRLRNRNQDQLSHVAKTASLMLAKLSEMHPLASLSASVADGNQSVGRNFLRRHQTYSNSNDGRPNDFAEWMSWRRSLVVKPGGSMGENDWSLRGDHSMRRRSSGALSNSPSFESQSSVTLNNQIRNVPARQTSLSSRQMGTGFLRKVDIPSANIIGSLAPEIALKGEVSSTKPSLTDPKLPLVAPFESNRLTTRHRHRSSSSVDRVVPTFEFHGEGNEDLPGLSQSKLRKLAGRKSSGDKMGLFSSNSLSTDNLVGFFKAPNKGAPEKGSIGSTSFDGIGPNRGQKEIPVLRISQSGELPEYMHAGSP